MLLKELLDLQEKHKPGRGPMQKAKGYDQKMKGMAKAKAKALKKAGEENEEGCS